MRASHSFTKEVKNETKHAKEYYGLYRHSIGSPRRPRRGVEAFNLGIPGGCARFPGSPGRQLFHRPVESQRGVQAGF